MVKILSLNGFKVHLNNVEHYTHLRYAHKEESFLSPVESSKKVLIDNFTKQQEKIEQYEKALLAIVENPNDWSNSYSKAYTESVRIAMKALKVDA